MPENHKPFSEQINVLMEEYGTGKLSEMTAISDTMLRKWRSGSSLPGLDKLLALSRATGKSIQWLATGHESGEVARLAGKFSWDEAHCDDFSMVNLYDAQVSMGTGAWNDSEHVISKLAFRKDWMTLESLKPDRCAAIVAKGDSMEETIKDGSTLLINLDDTGISRDGIYVIMFDGHLLAKRVQRNFDGGVIIKSDNAAYSEIRVPKERMEELRIIGRVVWHASSV